MEKYCVLKKNGSPVTAKLTVNNTGVSGIALALWERQTIGFVKIKDYQGGTEAEGEFEIQFDESAEELGKYVATWIVNTCIADSAIDNLTMRLVFCQGGIKCNSTFEFVRRGSFPSCESGKARKSPGQCSFVLIENPINDELWRSML